VDLALFSKSLKSSHNGSLHLSCMKPSPVQFLHEVPLAGALANNKRKSYHSSSQSKQDAGNLQSTSITQLIMTSERENLHGKKMRVTQSMLAQWLSSDLINAIEEPMIPYPQVRAYDSHHTPPGLFYV
jgi:hypothetical protein